MNSILSLHNISKQFHTNNVLEDINFDLRKGGLHSLVGENGAGKSTLLKIIGGLHQPTSGKIKYKNEFIKINDPSHARKIGISLISQECLYVPDLTIAENLFLGHLPLNKFGFVDWKSLKNICKYIFHKENLRFDINTKMKELSISQIQMIQIITAIYNQSEIIIMDEPTSSMELKEVTLLFEKIFHLKKKGISIIYISHKMEEIFKISDFITVLRDGRVIKSAEVNYFSDTSLVSYMVGREISNQYPIRKKSTKEAMAIKVKELSSFPNGISNISFYIKKGEIVGFAGLVGCGRTEIAKCIFGIDSIDKGSIYIENKAIKIRNVIDAIKSGIAMLSEDRRRYGLILNRSILENITIVSMKNFFSWKGLDIAKERHESHKIAKKLKIKCRSIKDEAALLSGGNQQKIVLGKWMMKSPKVFIMDEPTRGVDVGSKYQIYQVMNEMVERGVGILMISSELPELIGMCDRIYVISGGKIVGELQKEEFSQENIMQFAFKS